VLHGDARELALGGPYDGVVTSPPYPGLIDYHEQHRYAYELLGLDDRRERELGAAARGTSKAAIEEYVSGIAAVLARTRQALRPRAPVCIVVNDRRELYPEILERAGLRLEERLERHVNRRTGRRAGEYYESILICR
jgi:DNA modification methylase